MRYTQQSLPSLCRQMRMETGEKRENNPHHTFQFILDHFWPWIFFFKSPKKRNSSEKKKIFIPVFSYKLQVTGCDCEGWVAAWWHCNQNFHTAPIDKWWLDSMMQPAPTCHMHTSCCPVWCMVVGVLPGCLYDYNAGALYNTTDPIMSLPADSANHLFILICYFRWKVV